MLRLRCFLQHGESLLKGYKQSFGVIALLGTSMLAGASLAAPAGGVVSAGVADIDAMPGNVTIHQSSDRAVIDWNSFDIDAGEQVRILQPSAASAILNRIHDHKPSQIHGSLTANGQVVLVNPNGMVFGKTSQIDVAGLVASSADIADQDFMTGGALHLNRPGSPDARIEHYGTLTVKEAGMVAMVAPHVRNDGLIVAEKGTVALASGDSATVDLYGDGLLSLAVSDQVVSQAVSNNGTVAAAGGTVVMTAAQAGQAVDSVVNMGGLADVSSVTTDGGDIILGGAATHTTVSGRVDASSHRDGGKLSVQGKAVHLTDSSYLKATGATGGGVIHVGGGYQGRGGMPHADTALIEQGAVLNASATASGKGGEVVAWSDRRTEFHGKVIARGIDAGGIVETSSKGQLNLSGTVDASARNGAAGQWLLDPTDVTISSGAGTDVATCGGAPLTCDGVATIAASSVTTALNGGNDVTITTDSALGGTGNINASGVTISNTSGGARSLVLKANNNISLITTSITASGGGNSLNVTLNSDANTSNTASDSVGSVKLNATTLTTNGGSVIMGGGANPATTHAYGSTGAIIGVNLVNGSAVSTGAGTITINGRGQNGVTSTRAGVSIEGDSTLTSTTGNITINGIGGNGNLYNYGIRLLDDDSVITSEKGDISLTGVGGDGLSSDNYGILIEDGDVISTGMAADAGTISLNGTGGDGAGNSNRGVEIKGSDTRITSFNGNISIIGQGGSNGSAAFHSGVRITNGAQVTSTGTSAADAATITIQGTGATGTLFNYGTEISSASTLIRSDQGAILITGTAASDGTNGSNIGITVGNSAKIDSVGGGAGAATITLNGTGAVGTSNNRGLHLDTSAVVSSVDGNISLIGQGRGTSSNNHGIYITGSANVKSTGTTSDAATITINGTGAAANDDNVGTFINDSAIVESVKGNVSVIGDSDGTGNSNHGIAVWSAGIVRSTGTGSDAATLTFNGSGSDAGGSVNRGVSLSNTGTMVTSVDGDIQITGNGGDGSAGTNPGVQMLDKATLTSTGTTADAANITVIGTGGNGTLLNHGIAIENADTEVSALRGNISLTGTSGVSTVAGSNFGVYITDSASILSKGTGSVAGDITMNGTGKVGAGASNNDAVIISNSALVDAKLDGAISITGDVETGGTSSDGIEINTGTVTSVNGDITLAGTGRGDASSDGIVIESTSTVATSGTGDISATGTAVDGGDDAIVDTTSWVGGAGMSGDISFSANDLVIGATANGIRTSGDITIQPRAAGSTIGLGGAAGTMALSDAELDLIQAGTLIIGRTDGTAALTADAYANWGENVQLRSDSGVITVSGAQTVGANNFTITTNADPVISAGVTGTGVLTLETTSAATTMGIDAGAGTVSYSAAELTNLGTGWSTVQLGNTTTTGAMTVSAHSWADPVHFRAAGGGNIAITGAQTGAGASDATFTFTGKTTLSADLDSSAASGGTRAITFNSPVTLGGAVQLSSGAGNIQFADTLDGTFNLQLSNTGTIGFTGNVGASSALSAVTIDNPSSVTASGTFDAASLTQTAAAQEQRRSMTLKPVAISRSPPQVTSPVPMMVIMAR